MLVFLQVYLHWGTLTTNLFGRFSGLSNIGLFNMSSVFIFQPRPGRLFPLLWTLNFWTICAALNRQWLTVDWRHLRCWLQDIPELNMSLWSDVPFSLSRPVSFNKQWLYSLVDFFYQLFYFYHFKFISEIFVGCFIEQKGPNNINCMCRLVIVLQRSFLHGKYPQLLCVNNKCAYLFKPMK